MADESATKADMSAVNDRLKAIEEHMWFVRAAKWVFGLSVAALIGGVITLVGGGISWAYSAGAASNQVQELGKRVDKLEAGVEADRKEAREEAARLRELIIERLPHPVLGDNIQNGKVVKTAADKLTIKPLGSDGQEAVIEVSPDAVVTIDGKEAHLNDLKPGAEVSVMKGPNGKAVSISAHPAP